MYILYTGYNYSISSLTNLCTRGGLRGDRGPIPPSLKTSNLLNLAPYWKIKFITRTPPTHGNNVTWRFKAYPVDFKKGKDKVFASIFLFYTLVLQLCRPSMQKSVVSWKTKWIRVHCANTISQYRSILLILINI